VTDVALTVTRGIPREQADAARERVASALQREGVAVSGARMTLHRDSDPAAARPYVAAFIAFRGGRVLAAHGTGATPVEAADVVAKRLRDRCAR
jgi:hypothetical protein